MIDFQRVFELARWLDDLLHEEPMRFDSIRPSTIPSEGGIYLISETSRREERILYIGLSGNLSQRIYTSQFQGDSAASPVKAALIEHWRARDLSSAKEYLKARCAVRFSLVPDYREREMREGFGKAVLKPPFSLYRGKEH